MEVGWYFYIALTTNSTDDLSQIHSGAR